MDVRGLLPPQHEVHNRAGSGLARGEHGQPVPMVEGRGARLDRDAGGGFHVAPLNPAGVTAPDTRAGCS